MTDAYRDKVVWITGGGSGIGRAMAVEFARQGATLALSGRRLERLQEVVDELEARGTRALAIRCDVAEEADVRAAVETTLSTLGRLDVAVANAGFAVAGRIDALSAEDWRRQLDVNVVGLAVTARHAIPALLETAGRVVLVSSVAGHIAMPRHGAYNASKYAVRAIGQTLAAELYGSGVSCTTVYPGFVESEIAQVDNRGQHDPNRPDKRPQGLMWPADKAARVIVRAATRRKREYVFTWHGKFGAAIGRHAPWLAHIMAKRDEAARQARAKKTR